MDSWWDAAAWHREISSVLCDVLEGWDREGGIGRLGGRLKREGIWGYLYSYS